jgi:polyhydroxybutyrate depolymerase
MSVRWSLCALVVVLAGCTRSNLDVIEKATSDAGGAGAPDTGGAGVPDASNASDATDATGDTGDSAAVACPLPALNPGDITRTVRVGSTSRSYVLHLPTAYDGSKPAPLLVDFHANGGSGSLERSTSPYPAVTDAEGVVMAFPTGLPGPMGSAWNVGPCCVADVDDVGFARALVADAKTVACIDAKRIYATGVLTGGGMAYYLACNAADVFAAIAPAGFDLVQETVADCKPARRISVISFRGTAAQLVPYAGGASSFVPGMPVTFLGAQGTFQKWAELDQCAGAASSPDSNGCSSYANCQDGVEVLLCTKQGGGDEAGKATVAWPVLKRHRLP